MRTILYCRVSTEDQAEKYGLAAQLRACREYAKAHGLTIVAEISEDISGVILERPGLDKVRAMVRAGEVDIVLMYDADRLSRELAHLLILKPEIERHARLEFVAAKFEDSPSGRMFFGMRGVIAQYEREVIRERTMRGKRERARAGLIVGGRVPYGYRYDGGRLIPDPERAAVVQRIYAAYDAGRSIRGIARELTASGVPTWGGQRWGHSSVRRILQNETYAGAAHYGTHRREGTVLRLRPNADRIALPVPSLVSREVWQRIQARMAENPQTGRPSTTFLLRGVLYCSCGKRMHGERGRNNTYRCSGRESHTCRESVNAARVDAATWRALTATLCDPDALRESLRRHESKLRDAGPALDDLRKRADKLRRKEEAALSAILDPDLALGREQIKQQYRAIAAERRKVDAEISQAERPHSAALSTDEWIEDAAVTIRAAIADLEPAERQEFVRMIVSRAEWANGEISLRVFLVPKLSTTSGCYAQFQAVQVVVRARVA
jgi:site-specific DNA recombinase